MRCEDAIQKIGMMLDGELSSEGRTRLESHLALCESCRTVCEDHRSIKEASKGLRRTDPPSTLAWRIHQSMEAADRRSNHKRHAVASAAAVFLVGILFVLTSRSDVLPPLLAQTVELHEQLHRVPLRTPEETQKHLNKDIAVPVLGSRTLLKGSACCCCLPNGSASTPDPCLVYQKDNVLVSLRVTKQKLDPLPASHKQTYRGLDCYVFSRGSLRILLCQSAAETHIWMARMPVNELMEVVHSSHARTPALQGYRFKLDGLSCLACCATIENAVRKLEGVRAVEIDLAACEMTVSLDIARTRPEDVELTVKKAGFTARR